MRARRRALQNGFLPAVVREEQALVMENHVYRVQNVATKWGSLRAEPTDQRSLRIFFAPVFQSTKLFQGKKPEQLGHLAFLNVLPN